MKSEHCTKLFLKPKVKFVTYLKMVIRPDSRGGESKYERVNRGMGG